MADLDTAAKRMSGIGIDLPYLHVYPEPDGAFNQADRQQIAYKYRGILASGGAAAFVPRLPLLGVG